MKSLLLATVVTVLPLLAACPGLGCGGFTGGGDKVYARGTESLILCENGGFVANTTTGSFEGRYSEDINGKWFATNGATGELAFDFSYATDGSLDAPQLGTTAWTQQVENQ